ncbi:MAG TPA: hypothetical protein PKD28_01130 [Candidatus Saccharibacteria bacterium]|nr:hypothetical protein [Candidatus Saccharibacteria bacterium]
MSTLIATDVVAGTFMEIDGEQWLSGLIADRNERPPGPYYNRNIRTVIRRNTRMRFPVYKITSEKRSDGTYAQVKEAIRHLTLDVAAGTEAVIYRSYDARRGLYVATFFFEDRHVSLKAGPGLHTRSLST